MRFSRLLPCPDFMESCRHDLCHICLQPRDAHPRDDDSEYWAQWFVFHTLLELTCRVP